LKIDVLSFTDAQWKALTYAQREIIYAAQRKKNDMARKFNTEKRNAVLQLLAGGTARSSIMENKIAELLEEYEEDLLALADSTYDAMENAAGKEAETSGGAGSVNYDEDDVITKQSVYSPSSPDYSLSYEDRFYAVRQYYMSISDATKRYNSFLSDSVAKEYLGEYYLTMKRLLEISIES